MSINEDSLRDNGLIDCFSCEFDICYLAKHGTCSNAYAVSRLFVNFINLINSIFYIYYYSVTHRQSMTFRQEKSNTKKDVCPKT